MPDLNLLMFARRFRSLPAYQQAAVADLVESLGHSTATPQLSTSFGGLSDLTLRVIWENDDDAEYDRL
jgi:hypothetical protein